MDPTLFVKHRDGAIHKLSGRRAAKLKKELAAGRGGVECTQLVENGYEGFLDDKGEISDFESLKPEYFR